MIHRLALTVFILPLLVPQSPLEQAQRLYAEGKARDAIAVLEAVPSRKEPDLSTGSFLAWLYSQTGEPEKAIALYRELVAHHAGEVDLHNNLGALLFRRNRLEEAKSAFEAARELAPDSASPHFNLGLIHYGRGEFLAAAESFRRSAALDPAKAAYHLSLARAYRGALQFDRAVEAFRAGLARNPPQAMLRRARLELALTLKLENRYQESETELRGILTESPGDLEALFQLGRLHVAMNRYPEAVEEFRGVVQSEPTHAPALFMLGMVQYRQTAPDEALQTFRRLLEVDPGHAEARFFSGMLLRQLGSLDEASEAFEEALRSEPEHVGATYNLALVLARRGERERSQHLFEAFRRLSDRRETLDFLEERARLNPTTARHQFDLGREYARQDRLEDALRAYQRALELDPDLAAAEVALGELSERRGSGPVPRDDTR